MSHYPGMVLGFLRQEVGYIGTAVEVLGDSVVMAVSGDISVAAEVHNLDLGGQTFGIKFVRTPIARLVSDPLDEATQSQYKVRWVALAPFPVRRLLETYYAQSQDSAESGAELVEDKTSSASSADPMQAILALGRQMMERTERLEK